MIHFVLCKNDQVVYKVYTPNKTLPHGLPLEGVHCVIHKVFQVSQLPFWCKYSAEPGLLETRSAHYILVINMVTYLGELLQWPLLEPGYCLLCHPSQPLQVLSMWAFQISQPGKYIREKSIFSVNH